MAKKSFEYIVGQMELDGFYEIQSGVYIQTSENLLQEQESWCDEDEYKSEDFNTSPYWITTDNGEGIYPIANEIEYNEWVKEST